VRRGLGKEGGEEGMTKEKMDLTRSKKGNNRVTGE
jgi:hypothetical protein